MNTGKKNLFKNVVSLGAIQILNYAFPLLSVPVVSRIIGPDKFGVISYSATFIVYFIMFITYGFDLTATRKLTKDADNINLRNQVFSEVLMAKMLLFFLSIFIFTGCLYTVPLLSADKKIAIFSFFTCLSVVFTQNWLFQVMQDLRKIALLDFISKLIFTTLILLLIREKKDYFWQPLLAGLTQILFAGVSFYWAYKRYHLSFIKVSLKKLMELLWNEKTIFFSMVVISLYTTTNTVILGILQNETQVGYYSAAQRLTDVAASIISLPLTQALFPFVGAAFGKSREDGIETVQSISPIIVISITLITLFLLLAGPTLLVLFYGNNFSPSVPVFRILSIIPLITTMSNIFGIQIMLNLRMDKPFFYITAGGAIIGVVLNVLMVSKTGYVGTAWNYVAVQTYIMLAMYVYIRKQGVHPFKWQYFSPLALKEQWQPVVNKFMPKKKRRLT